MPMKTFKNVSHTSRGCKVLASALLWLSRAMPFVVSALEAQVVTCDRDDIRSSVMKMTNYKLAGAQG